MAKAQTKPAPRAAAKASPAPAKKAPPSTKKAVSTEVKNVSGAVASASGSMFQQYAGAGMEKVTLKDIIVPRIAILQALSPQLVKGKSEYNEDAKVGDIYNIEMGEILGDELLVVPVAYDKVWLEWFPRATNKGLANIHVTDDILSETHLDDRKRNVLPNGNYIAETAQFYCLNLSANKQMCFIPMTSTQLKKSRQWITLAQSEKLVADDGGEFTPPIFYRTYRISTQPEQNAEGNWIGWKIERGAKLEELEGFKSLFDLLTSLNKQVKGGQMRGNYSDISETETGARQSGDAM